MRFLWLLMDWNGESFCFVFDFMILLRACVWSSYLRILLIYSAHMWNLICTSCCVCVCLFLDHTRKLKCVPNTIGDDSAQRNDYPKQQLQTNLAEEWAGFECVCGGSRLAWGGISTWMMGQTLGDSCAHIRTPFKRKGVREKNGWKKWKPGAAEKLLKPTSAPSGFLPPLHGPANANTLTHIYFNMV